MKNQSPRSGRTKPPADGHFVGVGSSATDEEVGRCRVTKFLAAQVGPYFLKVDCRAGRGDAK
jgi:hypothetical protein